MFVAGIENGGRSRELAHWIESWPARPLSLATLAPQAAMSPYHLLEEFKRVTGTTPYQFIPALRLRRAARRLRSGDESVLRIALDVGFPDISEFNRRFRSILGTTPGAFRARTRQAGG